MLWFDSMMMPDDLPILMQSMMITNEESVTDSAIYYKHVGLQYGGLEGI